jgi:2'-5' RNA ligase
MRSFVALDLDEDLRNAIARLSSRMQRNAPKEARFADAKSLHITLKFFEDLDDDRAQTIGASLEPLAQQVVPIEILKVEAFPKVSHGRVIVLSIAGDLISQIASSIEDTCEALGIDREERAFHPHITIARLREARNVTSWLAEQTVSLRGAAEALTLYTSKLQGPNAPLHTPIARFLTSKESR